MGGIPVTGARRDTPKPEAPKPRNTRGMAAAYMSSPRAVGVLNTTDVREWARAQGIEVKDRGRVPAELVARFKAVTRN